MYGQIIFITGTKTIQLDSIVSSANGAVTNRDSHEENEVDPLPLTIYKI